jgi:midasin
MCLLVGHTSGRTEAVRSLARMAHCPLVELSLTSGTDTSDLLGGFEQRELTRAVHSLQRRLLEVMACAVQQLLLHGGAQDQLRTLMSSCIWNLRNVEADPESLLQSLAQLLSDSEDFELVCASLPELERLYGQNLATMRTELTELHEELSDSSSSTSAGRFEWVDGVLTR